jgi:hypothetical protein
MWNILLSATLWPLSCWNDRKRVAKHNIGHRVKLLFQITQDLFLVKVHPKDDIEHAYTKILLTVYLKLHLLNKSCNPRQVESKPSHPLISKQKQKQSQEPHMEALTKPKLSGRPTEPGYVKGQDLLRVIDMTVSQS